MLLDTEFARNIYTNIMKVYKASTKFRNSTLKKENKTKQINKI